MSVQSQEKFLTELQKKLLAEKGSMYRRRRANKTTHHLTVSKSGIVEGIRQTVETQYKGENVEDKVRSISQAVNSDIDSVLTSVNANIERLQQADRVAEVEILEYTPSVRIRAVFFASVNEAGSARNIYKQAFQSYSKLMDALAVKVGAASKKETGKSVGDKAKQYWNLEHAKNQGIAESHVADMIMESLLDIPDISFRQALAYFEAIYPEISIIRKTKTTSMSVHVGPKVGNLIEGQLSRKQKKDFGEIVDELIAVLNHKAVTSLLVEAPGSDSFLEIYKKRALKAALDPFSKLIYTRAQITSSSTKTKDSTTKVKSKDKSGRPKNATRSPRKLRAPRQSGRTSSQFSPLAMVAAINKKLPNTVLKNMNHPALESSSGRFAASTRITDIMQTPQGFPSFGYTYQKNPYEVFEMGNGSAPWATPERDPRTLIDRSIREIAVEFAIGRFYTRRT